MEVKCPHCTSRFNLPDNLAKPGVKLRCSVCKTVFPFAPEPEAVLPGEDELPDMQERPSGGAASSGWPWRSFCFVWEAARTGISARGILIRRPRNRNWPKRSSC